jgi:ketopantoate reductase
MSNEHPIVLVGVGEMGGVFGRALLRSGYPVHPVLRSTSLDAVASRVPEPALALVTVGEADLGAVLSRLPETWKGRVGLIQNELLPRDWERYGISEPTVAVVWFEKKPGRDTKVVVSTPVAGPFAPPLVDALEGIGLPAHVIGDEALVDALVVKNLYILTANIAGLRTGGTVSQLWSEHNELARAVVSEVLDIQEWLVGRSLDREAMVAGMLVAFDGDPEHGATGRSAPSRLRRALDHAATAGLDVPVMEEIAQEASLPQD